jgi:hypothetical protein
MSGMMAFMPTISLRVGISRVTVVGRGAFASGAVRREDTAADGMGRTFMTPTSSGMDGADGTTRRYFHSPFRRQGDFAAWSWLRLGSEPHREGVA